jgi:hypothetical protein
MLAMPPMRGRRLADVAHCRGHGVKMTAQSQIWGHGVKMTAQSQIWGHGVKMTAQSQIWGHGVKMTAQSQIWVHGVKMTAQSQIWVHGVKMTAQSQIWFKKVKMLYFTFWSQKTQNPKSGVKNWSHFLSDLGPFFGNLGPEKMDLFNWWPEILTENSYFLGPESNFTPLVVVLLVFAILAECHNLYSPFDRKRL